MHRIADFLLQFPRTVFAVLLIASIGAGMYLLTGGLRFDYNLEGFLPAGDPTILAFNAFAETYEPDDVFVAVGFDVENVYAYETLRAIEAMTASLGEIEGVIGVTSLTSLENIRATDFGIEIAPVVERIDAHPDSLAALESRLRADSLAVGFVVNPTADATALLIQIDPDRNNYDERAAIIAEARARLVPWGDQFDFRWSGYPYLRNTYVETLQTEVVRSVALTTLVILLVLVWMFRSVRGVVIPLGVVWLGVLWTIFTIMAAGSAIDVLTSSTAAIILVVAVADSIHLLAKYYDGLAVGLVKREAIRQMVIRLGAATLMTSVTTAIGFGTLATSRVVPMQRFGVFTAAGVLLTFALSVALIAVLLQWTGAPKPRTVRRIGAKSGLARLLSRLDLFVERHPRRIVAVAGLFLVVALAGASQLRVNAFVNDDLGPRTQVYQDLRWFEQRIVSPFRFEVLLTTDEPDAFHDPALLREVERIEAFLAAQPFVTRTASPTDFLKQLNRTLNADEPAAYVLPEDRATVAQYFLLLELTDEDFLRRFADFDYSEVRISASMNDVGSDRVQAFRDDFQAFLAETLPDGVTASTTGSIVLSADLSSYLVESLLLSIGLAFVFIALLMGALFRSAKLVLIALVPNVLPLIGIAGIMGAAGIDIKPATAVIFSIAFGIAVDDSIHVLARLRQEMLAGRPLREALRTTITGTGKALILTSVILAAGFLMLTTSAFQSTTYMGLLVSATIVFALLADLLLLPALLYLFYPELRDARGGSAQEPSQAGTPRAVV